VTFLGNDGLPPFLDHMNQAAENVCAGFYFEEGGCWGMALELQAALGGELLVRTGDFVHAYVRVDGALLDWQGVAKPRDGLVPMTTEAFIAYAEKNGADAHALESDRAWARECIATAQALSLAEIVRAPALETGATIESPTVRMTAR